MPEERRLAAIIFTDIAGYTALMGSNEDRAFAILKKNHEIHESLIKQFNGILIKEIVDGTKEKWFSQAPMCWETE
jgi:adenylate cyclase